MSTLPVAFVGFGHSPWTKHLDILIELENCVGHERFVVVDLREFLNDPHYMLKTLRSQGDGKGDVADPSTGYSPYPGNANNLVIGLEAYAKTLRGEDEGVVLEFVNPKYKDETRTDFKKPTRLECMMQDLPKLFQKELGSNVNIGYTMLDRWFTFSPAKVKFLLIC